MLLTGIKDIGTITYNTLSTENMFIKALGFFFAVLCMGATVASAHGSYIESLDRHYERYDPLIIFHDGGPDDTRAKLYMMYASDRYRIVATIASGNGLGSAAGGAANDLRIIETTAAKFEAIGMVRKAEALRSIIVVEGSSAPLSNPENHFTAIQNSTLPLNLITDGGWGTYDTHFPSAGNLTVSEYTPVQAVREVLRRERKRPTVLAIGPLTDLANAYDQIHNLDRRLGRVHTMGGAIKTAGNVFTYPINTRSEFNVFLDPLATKKVYDHDNVFVVPLDATQDVMFSQEYYDSVCAMNTSVAQWDCALQTNVRFAFGDEAYFNYAGILGGGYGDWDGDAARSLEDGGCDVNIRASLTVDLSTGPNNPSGRVLLSYDGDYADDEETICYGLDIERVEAERLFWLENLAL